MASLSTWFSAKKTLSPNKTLAKLITDSEAHHYGTLIVGVKPSTMDVLATLSNMTEIQTFWQKKLNTPEFLVNLSNSSGISLELIKNIQIKVHQKSKEEIQELLDLFYKKEDPLEVDPAIAILLPKAEALQKCILLEKIISNTIYGVYADYEGKIHLERRLRQPTFLTQIIQQTNRPEKDLLQFSASLRVVSNRSLIIEKIQEIYPPEELPDHSVPSISPTVEPPQSQPVPARLSLSRNKESEDASGLQITSTGLAPGLAKSNESNQIAQILKKIKSFIQTNNHLQIEKLLLTCTPSQPETTCAVFYDQSWVELETSFHLTSQEWECLIRDLNPVTTGLVFDFLRINQLNSSQILVEYTPEQVQEVAFDQKFYLKDDQKRDLHQIIHCFGKIIICALPASVQYHYPIGSILTYFFQNAPSFLRQKFYVVAQTPLVFIPTPSIKAVLLELHSKNDFLNKWLPMARQLPPSAWYIEIDLSQPAELSAVMTLASYGHTIFAQTTARSSFVALEKCLATNLPPDQIYRTVSGIIGCNLLPKLCPGCRIAETIENKNLFTVKNQLSLDMIKNKTIYRPAFDSTTPCGVCFHGTQSKRHYGSTGIIEVLEIASLKEEHFTLSQLSSLIKAKHESEWTSYFYSALEQVIAGNIDLTTCSFF